MNREVLQSAAHWYAQFDSGDASEADRAAWSQWLHAHPDHRRAWTQVEAMQHRLQQVPGGIAASALRLAEAGPVNRQRRRALKALVFTGVTGGALWMAHQQTPWPQRLAHYRTGVGERREWVLDDGSRLILNTASAADVDFDTEQRLVRLHAGEIRIETAPDSAAHARPFRVQTPQGLMRALGTRFVVQIIGEATEVAVLQHAVEIRPAAVPRTTVLQAGQRLRFTRDVLGEPQPAGSTQDAWTRGMLVVADRPLGEFIAELARYRRDKLVCDPAVAGLRLSGAYPLDNTDLALAAVEKSLPVRVTRRQGPWGLFSETRIVPR